MVSSGHFLKRTPCPFSTAAMWHELLGMSKANHGARLDELISVRTPFSPEHGRGFTCLCLTVLQQLFQKVGPRLE
jgi:hypothetical protein